jgi:hypothetical protein
LMWTPSRNCVVAMPSGMSASIVTTEKSTRHVAVHYIASVRRSTRA